MLEYKHDRLEIKMIYWTAADTRRARPVTSHLIDMADIGLIDWETLAINLLGYMSESSVADFARENDYPLPGQGDNDE